ncbi:MAG: hypothetical protein ACM3X9_08700 [Bacillota bacterium]
MERFNWHPISASERKRLQQRIEELEAENQKLKSRQEFLKELTGLFINNNRLTPGGAGPNGNGSLERVIELARDLTNDVKNLLKIINP